MKKEIKFYVNTWIFGNVSLREVIQRVASLGYDGVELVVVWSWWVNLKFTKQKRLMTL